jgi:hypothetical protein
MRLNNGSFTGERPTVGRRRRNVTIACQKRETLANGSRRYNQWQQFDPPDGPWLERWCARVPAANQDRWGIPFPSASDRRRFYHSVFVQVAQRKNPQASA